MASSDTTLTNAKLRQAYLAITAAGTRCACCWIPYSHLVGNRWPPTLEMAHIVSRARGGRKGQSAYNVVMLCTTCHRAQHGVAYDWPDVTEETLLCIKRDIPDEWYPEALAVIRGNPVAYIEHLADCGRVTVAAFEEERATWTTM